MKDYTEKTNVPQYIPTGKRHDEKMIDCSKYNEIIDEINKSNINEEIKSFLRITATRLIKYNYSYIAEFYSEADKETQELMEKQALVIIDFEDAIKNGYVKLSKKINKIIEERGK